MHQVQCGSAIGQGVVRQTRTCDGLRPKFADGQRIVLLQRAAVGIAQLQTQAVEMLSLVFHCFFNCLLIMCICQSLCNLLRSVWCIRAVAQDVHQHFHALCIAQALPHIGLGYALTF